MRIFYLLVISTLIFTSQAFAQTTGFTTQPSNASVCVGLGSSFTAAVNGNPSSYSVAWQVSTNSGTSWASAAGSFTKSGGSSTLTISSVSNSHAGLYRAVFTVSGVVFTSNTALLTVNQLPVDRSLTASASVVCSGTSANITLTAPAFNVTYQLRNNSNNSLVGLAQITNAASTLVFPVNNLTATTTFNMLATNSAGCSFQMSARPTITVNSTFPLNKTVSGNATVCYGTSANITVSNVEKNVTYQLMNNADNTNVGVSQTGNNTLTFNTGDLTSTTTFYVLATYGGCTRVMSVKPTISLTPLPVVTVNANYCYGGGKIQLTASSTEPSTYLWSNGSTSQSILVDIAANYTVTATSNATGCKATSSKSVAAELVINGDFSAGNTGFTTGYEYNDVANGLIPEGLYAVNNNANFSHPVFFGTDHTTGDGNFMVVNGSPLSTEPTVWEQVVTVKPNTNYYFAAWAVSINARDNYAQLRFSINGVQIGTTAKLEAGSENVEGPFNWVRFYGMWNSGTATTARIYIIDNQTALGGNDFGLDDISFGTLTPTAFTANVTNNLSGATCEGGPINFTTTLNGGLSPFTYSWTGPNSFTSTLKNPVISTSVAANSGTYTMSVTDGFGCPVSVQNTVTINALPISKTITAPVSTICSGTFANIQIANSQSGVSYKLRNNATNTVIGSAVNGTGSATAINLPTGNLTTSTTFNVLATNNTTGCIRQMGNTITITVNPNATINLSSAASTSSQSPCINTSITNITYTIGGGGTNATVAGLPAGVTGSFNAGVFTISGTPTATGTFNYTVTTSGTCTQTSATGSITVKSNATISLSSLPATNAQTVCQSTSITSITYSVNSSVSGATVSGLPAGLGYSFSGSTVTISGAPSVPGTFSYTVVTTGICIQASAAGTITVKPNATISLSSPASTNAQSICLKTSIADIKYTIGGGGTNASASGLPAGVTGIFNAGTFTISGTPTATGTFNYTVTTSGTCTQTSATGSITIKSNATISLSSLPSTNAQTLCQNTQIINITYSVNSVVSGATVSGLPSGVNYSFSGSTVTISGTPSLPGTFSYTVVTTGICTQASAAGTITVRPNATITLSSPASTNAQSICLRTSIADIKYTIGGGGTNATVAGLPAGVTGSFNAGVFTISGTPTSTGTSNYYVSTSGTCSQVFAAGTITVNQSAVISLSSSSSSNAQTICLNSTIASIKYDVSGSASGAVVSGLPAGLITSFGGGTFTISGKPSAAGIFNYTVTTTGTCVQASATGTITITATPSLTGAITSLVCANSPATVTLKGMVAGSINNTISYKINGTSQTPVSGVNADVSGNANFNTVALTSANNGKVLQVTGITNGNCSKSLTQNVTLTVVSSGTWLGINTNWFDASNWCGGVPTLATNVLIPLTASNFYPLITGSTNATTNSITLSTGALLTVNDGTVQIAGTITNSGSFRAANGSVEMKGAVAQIIPARTFTGDSLKNLIISNTSVQGVTLGGTTNLYGTLSFGKNNNQVLVSAGYLNLKSTANGTAKVADISNNNTNTNNKITGNVVVERYYPARRSWRLVTAPVSAKRSIFNEWQVGGGHTNSTLNAAPANSGTYITSSKPGPGVDKSLNYSMDSFNVATGKLVGINDTKNTNLSDSTINPGTKPDNKSYFMFVRGDRTPSNISRNATDCNITTLRDTGALQTYTKTFSSTLTSKNLFMLIGNPYASPVDFGNLTRSSNIPRKFWAWDPKLNERLGSYVLVDGMVGSSYVIVPNYSGSQNGNAMDQHIQSSQAVFVQSEAPGTASVTFNENDKATVSNNVFRPVSATEGATQALRANLYLVNADTAILADGIYAQYDNGFSNDIDIYDALKFSNMSENFGILKNTKTLILERRPLLNNNDTIFFKLWNTSARNYRLEFITDGLNHGGLQGYLEDLYLQTSTPVEMDGVTVVNFNVTAAAASKAANRFRIVFKSLAALPVSFSKVKAYQQGSNINVEWTMENEMNMKQYEVEVSTDGRSFTKATTAMASRNNNTSANYQWADVNIGSGTYFYRIRSLSINGEAQYSSIVKVLIGKGRQDIVIYPNPVVGGTINLQLINQPKGNYSIRLTNKLGQVIMVKDVQHENGSSTETLQLSKSLSQGAYQLEVTKPDNSTTSINVLY